MAMVICLIIAFVLPAEYGVQFTGVAGPRMALQQAFGIRRQGSDSVISAYLSPETIGQFGDGRDEDADVAVFESALRIRAGVHG
jgi:hypothetical protein